MTPRVARAADRAATATGTSTLLAAVEGQVTLLGATSAEGGRVSDAVVYLEPIDVPTAAPARTVTATAAARARSTRPGAAAAPAVAPDSVGLLWNAARELRDAVRTMRVAIAELRAAIASGRTPSGRAGAEASIPLAAAAALDSIGRPSAPAAETPAPEPPRPTPAAAPAPRPRERVAMLMQRKEFIPHVRVVHAGGAVEWPNRDPFSHNVFSNSAGGAFDLGLYPRGESRGAAFRRPGVYEIFCNIHSRMSAFVVAVPSPHYAQPAANGRFTIPDVPPGRYRVRVWHERAPQQERVVAVDAGGAARVDLTIDARAFRPAGHPNKFGQPYPTATRDEY